MDESAHQTNLFIRLLRWIIRCVVGVLRWVVLFGMIVWSTAAIYFSNLPSDALRKIAAIAYVVALIVVFIRVRPMWKARLNIVSGFLIVLAWFFLIPASNERDWQPDAAKIPFAEINGDRVAVHNIRNCDYQTETNFTVAYYDK